MSLSINTNLNSLSISRALQLQPFTSRRFVELASGRKPLTVSNPAGLVISQAGLAQLRRINQARENLEIGVSFAQTAEGGVDSIQEDLQRMRELAVQASSDTLTDEDRQAIGTEIQALKENIDQTVSTTSFNGQHPLSSDDDVVVDASAGPRIAIPGQGSEIAATLTDLATATDDFSATPSAETAAALVAQIDDTLTDMSAVRATYAAAETRFASTARSLSTASVATAEAEARIADADVARSAVQLAIARIFGESNMALLAQSNVNQALAVRLLSSSLLVTG